jgi:hypothetical protein
MRSVPVEGHPVQLLVKQLSTPTPTDRQCSKPRHSKARTAGQHTARQVIQMQL